MLDSLLSVISPHYCLSCGKVGSGLCVCCDKNILNQPLDYCVICNSKLINNYCNGDCQLDNVYQCVASRQEGIIKRLIQDMKFKHAREHAKVLGTILCKMPTKLDKSSLIVPIPTSARHIRQRGFDHTKLIAKEFAKRSSLRHASLLGRNYNYQQVGGNRQQRLSQVKDLFYCKNKSFLRRPVIILDDVVTTGATISAAVDCLRLAGYENISIIAIAHQTLAESS